jgi:phosphate transport system permease protein
VEPKVEQDDAKNGPGAGDSSPAAPASSEAAASSRTGAAPPPAPLRTMASRVRRSGLERAAERAIEILIRLSGISAIIFVFAIFLFVLREGAPIVFGGLNLGQFLFSTEWVPTSQSNVRFGVLALVAGTASVTVLAMLIAVPFGLGAAVFVSEFCDKRTREALKIIIELLAAVPSVVWGFIGISVMNPLIQHVFHVPVGLNVLNGALLLALMSVPIMVSIGEDALKAVPDSYREAAIGLGATRWQIVYRVLLPAAKNGLLAAVLLGVGRAVGETMAVLMATGHAINIPHGIFDPVRTLTATIAAELGEASVGSAHYRVLFLVGILLFAITFVVNLVADFMVKGIRRR